MNALAVSLRTRAEWATQDRRAHAARIDATMERIHGRPERVTPSGLVAQLRMRQWIDRENARNGVEVKVA